MIRVPWVCSTLPHITSNMKICLSASQRRGNWEIYRLKFTINLNMSVIFLWYTDGLICHSLVCWGWIDFMKLRNHHERLSDSFSILSDMITDLRHYFKSYLYNHIHSFWIWCRIKINEGNILFCGTCAAHLHEW